MYAIDVSSVSSSPSLATQSYVCVCVMARADGALNQCGHRYCADCVMSNSEEHGAARRSAQINIMCERHDDDGKNDDDDTTMAEVDHTLCIQFRSI